MKNPIRIWILLVVATILTIAPSAFGNWGLTLNHPSNDSTENQSNALVSAPVPGTQLNQYGEPREYFGFATTAIATPEPEALAMLGIGLFALGSFVRRKLRIRRPL